MPLRIHLHNDPGRLAAALVESLAAPPADVFAEDVLLVPTLGVGRWLEDRLADAAGVCAVTRVELVGRFLWNRFARLLPGLPERSPFDVQVARWAILAAFDEIPDEPWALPLSERIPQAGDRDRLALAERIAGLFDRYLAYRRDWLAAWQRGESVAASVDPSRRSTFERHEPWQRWLWQRLVARLPGVSPVHPVERIASLIDDARARGGLDGLAARMGAGRIRLFGRPRLSPDQWAMLALLASIADIACFIPDPCREFWEDIVSRRALARILAERPDVAWLYDGEPSILGDFGKAHRDTLVQVRQLEERFGAVVDDTFRDDEPSAPRHALAALQRSVLDRSNQPWTMLDPAAAADDRSILVDGGYGLARQIEVLHDRLLEALVDLPDLRPADIVVGCVDLEAAAPLVEAVFGAAARERRIPYTITGRTSRTNPLVSALGELLVQADGDRHAARLAGLFDNPALCEAYGLDVDDVAQLGEWLIAAGARGDGTGKHGVRAAIERLLLGAAATGDAHAIGDRLPIGAVAVGAALPLGALLLVLDDLDALGDDAAGRRPVTDWCRRLRQWLERRSDRLLSHLEGVRLVREALDAIEEGALAGGRPPIDLAAFRHVFDDAFGERRAAAAPSGGVTFCPIGALPGVPFRVVALIGLDEGAFPAASDGVDIDLMALRPVAGDPQPRFEERGLFLDALLSARDRLLLAYGARDVRDASVCNPSPVLVGLLAWLQRQPGVSIDVILHPLQPFSPRCFDGVDAGDDTPRPVSFADEWRPAAAVLARPIAQRPGITPLVEAGRPLTVPAAMRWRLPSLRDVYASPARGWLRRVLEVGLPRGIEVIDDEEPLEPMTSAPPPLVQEVADALLDGGEEAVLRARLAADPRLADGPAGERDRDCVWAKVLSIREAVLAITGGQAPTRLTFVLRVPAAHGPVQIDGAVDGILAAADPDAVPTRIEWTAFPLGAHAIVSAWIHHCAWLAASGRANEHWPNAQTILVGPDRQARIVSKHPPMSRLVFLLEAAERIAREAPPLLPKTGFALHYDDPRSAATTLGGARQGRVRRPGEAENPWIALRHRDRRPTLDEIRRCAEMFYAPVFEDVVLSPSKARPK